MNVVSQTVASVMVIGLQGDLDSRSAAAAQEQILALLPAGERVLIDLSGVPYVSSAGLRIMLLIYRQAQCIDSSVALVGLSDELRSVMSATGFLGFFTVADGLAAGLRALGAAEPVRSGAA